jgi:uncharacterized membrane protein (UPF0136 family)
MYLTAFVPAVLSKSLPTAQAAISTSRLSTSTFRGRAVMARRDVARARVAQVPSMALTPATTRAMIAAYGVVVAGGGVGAFLKTKSKMSIISGLGSGLVLAAAFATENTPLALGTAIALAAVFAIRLAKTKKLMPAGALMAMSLVFAAAFGYAMYA